MKVEIRDSSALQAVSPTALAAYARAAGWTKLESYGEHSDVYVGEHIPEVIVPRTQLLADYPSVVSRLIEIFAQVAERDELSLYRDLITADRDVVRVRVTNADSGSLSVNEGVELVRGARDLLLAAACSLWEPRPLYRAGANRDATELVNRVRLGQTEHGSFVVTLLTPPVPPPMQTNLFNEDDDLADFPIERRVTRRLTEALLAVRSATEMTAGGDGSAFAGAVEKGVSANLCDALVKVIGQFPTIDVTVAWARTWPVEPERRVVGFAEGDSPILRQAAASFRDREPQPETRLFGFVRLLKRGEGQDAGTISLDTSVDGAPRSVTAALTQSDYDRAIQAHKEKAPIVLKGDLERAGQRWRLLSPRVTDVIHAGPTGEEEVG